MIRLFLLLFACSTLLGCGSESTKKSTEKKEAIIKNKPEKAQSKEKSGNEEKPETHSSKYRIALLFDAQIGWGYDIFEGSKLVIHQPSIPAIQGIRGFKNEADAQKVADAVANKLEMGIMPPTLSVEEMKELGVL